MTITLSRLSRALANKTLDEALEELALEAGVKTEAEGKEDQKRSGDVCERMLEDLRLARSSAENSIQGGIENVKIKIIFAFVLAGTESYSYSEKRKKEMDNAVRIIDKINDK